MSSGSSNPQGYQTAVTNTDPWGPQQDYLKTGFARAETDVLNKPLEYYPNSTVVPFASQTTDALQMREARARAGSPTTAAAQGMTQQTLSGDYLSAGNPYMQNAVTAATRPMVQNFQENVMPSIQSTFSNAGRYGSGAQAMAAARASEGLSRAVGDVAGTMAMQNYGDERARQLQAAT